MQITVLTTSYPDSADSVSGVFVMRLVRALSGNIKVSVITPCSDRTNIQWPAGSNISVRCFRYFFRRFQLLAHQPGGIPVALKRRRWLYLLLPLFLLSMGVACFGSARKSRLIHANWAICGLVAGITGYLCKVPVITTLRGADVERARLGGIDKMILSGCVRLSRRVVCVSEGIRQFLLTVYPEQQEKFRVIPNGIDRQFINASPELSPEGTLKILCVGSLIPRKGHRQLVESLAQLGEHRSGILVTLIGDGECRNELQEQISSVGLDGLFDFVGEVRPDTLPDYYSASDVLVLTSYSEGRPNVVLEAMGSSLPVVATAIEGVDELVVQGETGYLFEPGDTDSLAKFLLRLKMDRKLRATLGAAGRERILEQGLLWENSATRYAQCFEDVLKPT